MQGDNARLTGVRGRLLCALALVGSIYRGRKPTYGWSYVGPLSKVLLSPGTIGFPTDDVSNHTRDLRPINLTPTDAHWHSQACSLDRCCTLIP